MIPLVPLGYCGPSIIKTTTRRFTTLDILSPTHTTMCMNILAFFCSYKRTFPIYCTYHFCIHCIAVFSFDLICISFLAYVIDLYRHCTISRAILGWNIHKEAGRRMTKNVYGECRDRSNMKNENRKSVLFFKILV